MIGGRRCTGQLLALKRPNSSKRLIQRKAVRLPVRKLVERDLSSRIKLHPHPAAYGGHPLPRGEGFWKAAAWFVASSSHRGLLATGGAVVGSSLAGMATCPLAAAWMGQAHGLMSGRGFRKDAG